MTGFVQMLRSTDTGAPTLKGTAGALTDLLDACLVNGYATASVTSITRSSGTATVTIASNTTLRTGDWITISGANESDYNGTFQITVTGATTFTYAVANAPSTPATGTILYKKAGLGWTTEYTGTNKRVYRPPDVTTNRYYLRVDDSTTVGNVREAWVRGYVTMSDVDTGTEPFPTVAQATNGMSWPKSSSADSTARAWRLIGDGRTFYIVIDNGIIPQIYGFGHFFSYKGGDAYNTFLAGTTFSNWTTYNSGSAGQYVTGFCQNVSWGATSVQSNLYGGIYVPRSYTQLGSPVQVSPFYGRNPGNFYQGLGYPESGMPYPNGPDSGLWLAPVFLADHQSSTFNVRGRFPGLYTHLHNSIPCSVGDIVTGVVGMTGKTLIAYDHYGYWNTNIHRAQAYFDITGDAWV